MAVTRISRGGFGLIGLATLAALAVEPASSREASAHAPLDLKLRPGDVAPAAGHEAVRSRQDVPAMGEDRRPWAYAVESVDQVERQEIPNQPRLAEGELEVGGSDFLKDLLENRTIPLFRFTLQPSL